MQVFILIEDVYDMYSDTSFTSSIKGIYSSYKLALANKPEDSATKNGEITYQIETHQVLQN